jgi:hypothetical protein
MSTIRLDWQHLPHEYDKNSLFIKEWAGDERLTLTVRDMAHDAERALGHRFDLTPPQEAELLSLLQRREGRRSEGRS